MADEEFTAKSVAQLAHYLHVSERTALSYIERGMPCEKGDRGKAGRYPIADAVGWCKANVWCKIPADADPLLAGSDSPALERYRAARAEMVEMDLRVRRGDVFEREYWQTFMTRVCGVLRQAGDILQRQFGPQAFAVLDDALNGIEREQESFFGTESGDHD